MSNQVNYVMKRDEELDSLLYCIEVPKEYIRDENYGSLAVGALKKFLAEEIGIVDLITTIPSACGWEDLAITHNNWSKYRFKLLNREDLYVLEVYEYNSSLQGFYIVPR